MCLREAALIHATRASPPPRTWPQPQRRAESCASPHPRQNRARLGASENGIEELILFLPLDETCGDCGTTSEANSRGRSGWMACGHTTDLPDVLRRRSQWLVSLRLPQGVAMPPIVQADGNAEAGFVRRRNPTLRSTEITWGNGRIRCPTSRMPAEVN